MLTRGALRSLIAVSALRDPATGDERLVAAGGMSLTPFTSDVALPLSSSFHSPDSVRDGFDRFPGNQAGSRLRCPLGQCREEDLIIPTLNGVNDGPEPYMLTPNAKALNAQEMSKIYHEKLGISSVRPDEAGEAFDIRCMFPVDDLNNLPDPSLDESWNWGPSDAYFEAIVGNGFAPLLKLPVFTWTSTKISGLSYVDRETQSPVYLIPPKRYASCNPWPAISPVINQIGPQLTLKIIQRYNDPERWGMSSPPLEAETWPSGFAGVELMNEWDTLICTPDGATLPKDVCMKPGGVTMDDWRQYCIGEPFSWGTRYWDGTPEQAYSFYVSASKLIKRDFPRVRVGGPATGTGRSFWPCTNERDGASDHAPYAGIATLWVNGFLRHISRHNAPLDFFSWHFYGNGFEPGTSFEHSNLYITTLLSQYGYANTKNALTEWNARFHLGTIDANVQSAIGAAQNAAKIAMMDEWKTTIAAFQYTGRNGAFEAHNPWSFPLGCKTTWRTEGSVCTPSLNGYVGCTPADVVLTNYTGSAFHKSPNGYEATGVWTSDSCQDTTPNPTTGSSNQFGPTEASGMGLVYADGALTPQGAQRMMMKDAFGSRRLALNQNLVRAAGLYALAWQTSDSNATILLINPFSTRSKPLPSISVLLEGATVIMSALTLETVVKGSDCVVSIQKNYNETRPLEGRVVEINPNGILPANSGMPTPPRAVPYGLEPYQVVQLSVARHGCLC